MACILLDGNTEESHLKSLHFTKETNRITTFNEWPFQSPAKCTAEAMAQAGFVHTPVDSAPDLVICFFCCKEMDGWEPEDDPWDEHVKHTRGKCQFLKCADDYESGNITYRKALEMESLRQSNIVQAQVARQIQLIRDKAADTKRKILQLCD